MRRKNYKGKCLKRKVAKCKDVVRAYDDIQYAYAQILSQDERIKEFECNVDIMGAEYTTDFLCKKVDGDISVRECVYRKLLNRPLTIKQLDISRDYWLKHGVMDWGLVINEEK